MACPLAGGPCASPRAPFHGAARASPRRAAASPSAKPTSVAEAATSLMSWPRSHPPATGRPGRVIHCGWGLHARGLRGGGGAREGADARARLEGAPPLPPGRIGWPRLTHLRHQGPLSQIQQVRHGRTRHRPLPVLRWADARRSPQVPTCTAVALRVHQRHLLPLRKRRARRGAGLALEP